MLGFIGLTTISNARIWVNAKNVATVEEMNKGSLVGLYSDAIDLMVKETPKQILDMVEEVSECRTCSAPRT